MTLKQILSIKIPTGGLGGATLGECDPETLWRVCQYDQYPADLRHAAAWVLCYRIIQGTGVLALPRSQWPALADDPTASRLARAAARWALAHEEEL